MPGCVLKQQTKDLENFTKDRPPLPSQIARYIAHMWDRCEMHHKGSEDEPVIETQRSLVALAA